MKSKANQTIRDAMKRKGIPIWQAADAVGYSETHLGRLLRHELDEHLKQRIEEFINQYE